MWAVGSMHFRGRQGHQGIDRCTSRVPHRAILAIASGRGITTLQFGYLPARSQPASEPNRLWADRAWEPSPLEGRVRVRKPTPNLVVAGSILATVVAVVGSMVAVPAAGATSPASKPSTSVLVPASAAKAAGFANVVSAPSTSTNTGVTGCPYGAHEEFASVSGNLGLESEVLYCESAADAATILKGLASNGEAQAGVRPPKSLGSTAVERLGTDSTYLIALAPRRRIRTDRPVHGPVFKFDDKYHRDRGSAHCVRRAGAGESSDTAEREIYECDGFGWHQRFGRGCEGAGSRKRSFGGGWLSKKSHNGAAEAEVEHRTGHDHRYRQGILRHGENGCGYIRHCA